MRCTKRRIVIARRPRGVPFCALLLGLLATGPAAAAPPRAAEAPPGRGYLDPLFYRDLALESLGKLRQREIVQMVAAVAGGSRMGPGEGWFHPGRGRHDWKWLAARFDA